VTVTKLGSWPEGLKNGFEGIIVGPEEEDEELANGGRGLGRLVDSLVPLLVEELEIATEE